VKRRAVLFTLIVLALMLVCVPAANATCSRGIALYSLIDPLLYAPEVDETANQLHAVYIRIDMLWFLAEPSLGGYADTGYLARMDQIISLAKADGLKIILTVVGTPKWASDPKYWIAPIPGYEGYQAFYPIDPAHLADFQAFISYIATRYKGEIFAYECWNEPNLWTNLYPQTTPNDSRFAAHTYFKMLKRFWTAVKGVADPAKPLVLGGSTAPGGGPKPHYKWRTSPQAFARDLKKLGASRYFNAFSHHPYVLGGMHNMSPSKLPLNRKTTVGLSNIRVLLRIFPKKKFYMTEYGFQTQTSAAFGFGLSEIQQAVYLKKAYRMASRYRQIKVLMWYMLQDYSPKGLTWDPWGVYLGLKALDGHRKRAWYAFAGGNHLTLTGPASAPKGSTITLTGLFTTDSIGPVAGIPLSIQKKVGTGPWVQVSTAGTAADGTYSVGLIFSRTCRYRVAYKGVSTSKQLRVTL
jgi:hypothetical protein